MSLATKRLSWALALSLGLNLFLIAFGVMRWMERRDHDPQRDRRARREQAEELIGKPEPDLVQQRAKIAAARARVLTTLSADPFHRARAYDALAELRTNIMLGQELLHEQMLKRFEKAPPEQRRTFADRHFARPHRDD